MLAHRWQWGWDRWEVAGLLMIGKWLGNCWCRDPLICNVFEQNSEQRIVRPLLGLYWQMVRWQMERQGEHFLLRTNVERQ